MATNASPTSQTLEPYAATANMSFLSILLSNNIKQYYSINENGYIYGIDKMPTKDRWLSIISYAIKILMAAENSNELKFLYRGERREVFGRKTGLISDFNRDPHYGRFFVIGSKAKSYYENKNNDIPTIKQFDHHNKELYIFNKLNKLSETNEYRRYLPYFYNCTNINDFMHKFSKIQDNNVRITIENYYLAFIHTISSDPIAMEAHSVLLSSTKRPSVAKFFSDNGFVIGFWLKRQFANQAIDYNDIGKYHDLINQYSFPAITEINYPDESEVTIFSAIFPHNILFVYDVVNDRHIFNPYLLNTEINCIAKKGIKVDQRYFSENISGIYSHSIWGSNSELLYEK